ncbi:pyridoxal phosphate-dependent aminotransferase [Ramlibacter sp. XY19]|uniref:pyridoxal phosphate-dependent aminotransferase n=1 Tax=Ramlibacter paludis TaxID=2908000 RepID=UPI0023D9B23B|nr:pyridoxal phosphate-dependent aminotransferase [Ramlibacter paludis]MCG2594775.1 pyridoxal phosphate-dependent aminotransferase [Ramlibacter paludis]
MAAKALVERLRAAGRTIVDFTIGEPDFATPPHIVAAGVQALAGGQTRYTASAGIAPLRGAIAAKLARENGLAYTPEQVVVGIGAKHVIYNALAATLNEGDEVIVPAPYWVSYPDMVALHGGQAVIVASDERTGFKLVPEVLERAITPRTRWLILNSPNNPTGAVYSADELKALGAVLLRHPHVWLMTDEIYEHFVYGGARHASLVALVPELAGRSLVVNGMSKAYAMTGWRVGYGAGPQPLIQAMTLLLTQSVSCAPAMTQAAAIAALEGPQDGVAEARRLFEQRRDLMVRLLRRIPGIQCAPPDGAFYVFASVAGLLGATTPAGKRLASDVDVLIYFTETAGVAAIDGSSYGLPAHLRLSFATATEQIEAGCAALASAVGALTLSHPTEEPSHA